ATAGAYAYQALGDFIKTAAAPEGEGASYKAWRANLVASEGQGGQVRETYLRALRASMGVDTSALPGPLPYGVARQTEGALVSNIMIALQYDGDKDTSFFRLMGRNASVPFDQLLGASGGFDSSVLRPTLDFMVHAGFMQRGDGDSYGLT